VSLTREQGGGDRGIHAARHGYNYAHTPQSSNRRAKNLLNSWPSR
jgi:hypothetical protein